SLDGWRPSSRHGFRTAGKITVRARLELAAVAARIRISPGRSVNAPGRLRARRWAQQAVAQAAPQVSRRRISEHLSNMTTIRQLGCRGWRLWVETPVI